MAAAHRRLMPSMLRGATRPSSGYPRSPPFRDRLTAAHHTPIGRIFRISASCSSKDISFMRSTRRSPELRLPRCRADRPAFQYPHKVFPRLRVRKKATGDFDPRGVDKSGNLDSPTTKSSPATARRPAKFRMFCEKSIVGTDFTAICRTYSSSSIWVAVSSRASAVLLSGPAYRFPAPWA